MAKDEIVVAGLTHQGMVRKDNQDSYGSVVPDKPEALDQRGRLFIVADGLGGHRGGQVASRMAVDIIRNIYYSTEQKPIYPALLKALETANSGIFESSSKNEDLQGMATTCTVLVVKGSNLYMAHVGDSRAYLVRDGAIKQLSTDHTLVEEMVHSGIINEEEARSHPDSHILTRSLGILPSVEVDILEPPLQLLPGDLLMQCSDGLTTYLESDEILKVLLENNPEEACRVFIETANERGGRDNITVQIVQVVSCVQEAPTLLEDTQPLFGHTDKILGKTAPVKFDEPAPNEGQTRSEIAWAGLFYILYIIGLLAYFYYVYKS